MAYINFQNCTKQEYEQVIYSGSSKNKLKVLFNGVEFQNIDNCCEKLTRNHRILPNDGSKKFSLGNFIAQELTLVLHDVNIETIQDPITISIGTLVNNTYEYVPLGVFNIQDTPTTDKNKITIKLRDNRVKFDFGYDAKPLIDNQYVQTPDTNYLDNKEYYSYNSNVYTLLIEGTDYEVGDAISGTVYQKKGYATKMQILNDICTQAGVTNDVSTFAGENDPIGIYDNTINGNIYVAYLAEQAGMIATITREGHLKFIDLTNLTTQRIPLSIVEKYELDEPYEIERVVYEAGAIKYQSSADETLTTLFLDGANVYINSQSQINTIYTALNGFTIDSLTTGKILGNPAIDPYDIIEIYDDSNINEPIIARTLANLDFTYTGIMTNIFNTVIGKEARKENTTKSSEETFKKYVNSQINNVDAKFTVEVGEINSKLLDNEGDINTNKTNYENLASRTTTLEQTIEGWSFTFTNQDIQDLKDKVDANDEATKEITKYIKFENGNIILGSSDSQNSVIITQDEIDFMTGDNRSAYISNNQLYITDSTILNKLQIDKWETKPDDQHNLNTRWIG